MKHNIPFTLFPYLKQLLVYLFYYPKKGKGKTPSLLPNSSQQIQSFNILISCLP